MPQLSITRRDLEIVSFIAIAILAVWYWSFPLTGETMMDHYIYIHVFELMKDGVPYYEAMDRALRIVYGPAESTRAFRTGTIFTVWSVLPNARAVWTLLIALFIGSGIAMIGLARYPICAIPATAFLIVTANLHGPEGTFLQFTTTEFWAFPFVAVAMLLWKKEYWKTAAVVALCAVLIRETTAHLLIAGLIASFIHKTERAPWMVAIGIATAALMWHVHLCAPFLVDSGGRETRLFFFGDIAHVARMMGFSMTAGVVVGPLLWCLAIWRLQEDESRPIFAILFLLLPWVGLIVHRPYWGILFIPLTILWGLDGLILISARGLRRLGVPLPRSSEESDERDQVEKSDDERDVPIAER